MLNLSFQTIRREAPSNPERFDGNAKSGSVDDRALCPACMTQARPPAPGRIGGGWVAEAGTVQLHFQAEVTRFGNLAREDRLAERH
jgi:hypothetical protein